MVCSEVSISINACYLSTNLDINHQCNIVEKMQGGHWVDIKYNWSKLPVGKNSIELALYSPLPKMSQN